MIWFNAHCKTTVTRFIFAALVFVTCSVTAEEKTQSLESSLNHLRISAARSAHDLRIIEALVDKFKEKYPDIQVTITSGGVLAVIDQGRNG